MPHLQFGRHKCCTCGGPLHLVVHCSVSIDPDNLYCLICFDKLPPEKKSFSDILESSKPSALPALPPQKTYKDKDKEEKCRLTKKCVVADPIDDSTHLPFHFYDTCSNRMHPECVAKLVASWKDNTILPGGLIICGKRCHKK